MADVQITSAEKDALISQQAMQILNLRLSPQAHVRVIGELEIELAAATAEEKVPEKELGKK